MSEKAVTKTLVTEREEARRVLTEKLTELRGVG